MKITFDINDFQKDKTGLLKILRGLDNHGLFKQSKETDAFFLTSPALAYNYVNQLKLKNKIDSSLEKIFLDNPRYGLKYLNFTKQKRFKDEEINKKFLKKIYNNPIFSYCYSSMIIKKRIPQEHEPIFLNDFKCMYYYWANILCKKKNQSFSELINKKIKMLLFSNKFHEDRNFQYLKWYIDKDASHVEPHYYYWMIFR